MSVHQRKGGTSWAYKIRIPDPEAPGKLKVKMRSGYRRQGDARRAERFELGHTREREEPEYCYLDPNGVRVAYGPTAHAESFERQQRAAVTVRSEIEHYLTTHRDQLSPTTYSGYEIALRVRVLGQRRVDGDWVDDGMQVQPRIADRPLADLDAPTLQRWVDWLRTAGRVEGGGLAQRTTTNTLSALQCVIAAAVREGRLESNPLAVKGAVKVRTNRSEPETERVSRSDVWTADQVAAFLQHHERHRHHALWTLAFYTGMRRSELLGLTWRNVVDLDGPDPRLEVRQVRTEDGYRQVHVKKTPKTRSSEREVPILPPVAEVLRALRGEWGGKAGAFVLVDHEGAEFGPHNLLEAFHTGQRSYRRAEGLTEVELPKLNLHYCRHTYATVLLSAGIDVYKVQRMLGHSNIGITTGRYGHWLPDLGLADELSEAFGVGSPEQ